VIDALDEVLAPILEEAGAIALRWFRTSIVADDKNAGTGVSFDPVTEADRGIEDLIRARLAEHFPDHRVTGEERGTTGASGRYEWLIDPIDGTKAFVSGSPLWGIMVGLLDDGVPVAGWIHQPYIGETFSALDGVATFSRGAERAAMHTRADASIDTAVFYTTFPGWFRPGRQLDALERISAASKVVRYGGDCYSYCMLAMGHVDLIVETGLQRHDIVPVIPIVEAAGGVVSGLDGQPAADGGFVIAAANPALHGQALALIGD
jgi:myo-inositol-1(or 4)-monophosphatase